MANAYLDKTKHVFERINQILLSFPIWAILGISGSFKSYSKGGWKKSYYNKDKTKMY